MFAQERHNAIKRIVRKQRRINFAELQRQVKVSPATLRRDLTELEEAGEIIRVHGGVLDASYMRSEVSFDERILRNSAAKKLIAAAAASMVPPGASVLVDAGSTCLEAGKALLGRKDVRIITHSVGLVEAGVRGEAHILCIGGDLRKVSGAMTGGSALGALAKIHADIVFTSASGLDPVEGCSTTETSEAEMKQAMLSRATQKFLLSDHTKWGHPSTIRFAGWEEFDCWITDKKPAAAELKKIGAGGMKIRVA